MVYVAIVKLSYAIIHFSTLTWLDVVLPPGNVSYQ